MIALNSDEAILPIYNHGFEEIQAWRNRYSKQEYPQKLMIITFYGQHTINFMWDLLYSPFYSSFLASNIPKFSDYFSAREYLNQIYNQTKLAKTQQLLMGLLQKEINVGGLITKIWLTLLKKELIKPWRRWNLPLFITKSHKNSY